MKNEYLITIFLSALAAGLFVYKWPLGILVLIIPVLCLIFNKVSLKNFFLIFLFLYPLMPVHFGFDFGYALPVLRMHRIMILLLILYLLFQGKFIKIIKNFFDKSAFKITLRLFIIWLFIVPFYSSLFRTLFFSLSIILEYILLTTVTFYCLKDKDDIQELMNVLILTCIILCIIGIIERYTKINIYSYLPAYRNEVEFAVQDQIREGSLRIKTSFNHPIAFGAYIVLLLPITIQNYRKRFVLLSFSMFLMLVTILFTKSRSAYLGTFIVLILSFLFIERKFLSVLAVIFSIFCFFRYDLILKYLYYFNPFSQTSKILFSSTMARFIQFDIVTDLILKKPFCGYGASGIPLYKQGVFSVDNFYLLFAYKYGLIGLIIYLIFIVSIFYVSVRLFRKDIFQDKLLLAILISMITFFSINIIVSLWSYHFLFCVLIGVLSRLIYNRKIGRAC